MASEYELDNAYIDISRRWAAMSKAQRLQVGCIIVKDNQIISDGFNGTPSGFNNVCEDNRLGNLVTKPEVLHAESNALMTVTNQANSVGYWVSRDILTAQSVNASDDSGTGDIEFVVMNWKNWETGDMHDIRYIWLASADSLQKVKRKQVIRDKNDVEISNKVTLVADNIYSANLTQEDARWKLIVEAHSGDRSLNREYFISQREEQ